MLFVLWLVPGCGGEADEQVVQLPSETGQWQVKYESLVNRNEETYQQLAALKADNERLQKECEALEGRLEVQQEAEVLKQELTRQRQRVKELEAALAQARGDEGGQVPLPEDLRLSMARARERLEQLGAVLFQREKYSTAHAVILSALQVGSESPQTYYQLAFCEAVAGSYDTAAERYRQALEALEAGPEQDRELLKKCLNNYGIAMMKLGDAEKAAELYQKAIALDDAYAPAYFNLGLVYANELNRPEDAVEALRKHIIHGGRRGVSARDTMRRLQASAAEDKDEGTEQ